MADILTEIHGPRLGLDRYGNLCMQNEADGQVYVAVPNPGTDAGSLVAAAAATLAITRAKHHNRTIAASKVNGQAFTLPAATGLGTRIRIVIAATITSVGTTIKVANATDVFVGRVIQSADGGNTVVVYDTAATDDTLTLDGATTGGLIGDVYEFEDIAAGKWLLDVRQSATGAEATPLSATVS